MESTDQITTLTFYKYDNWQDQLWAFGMMQFAHAKLKRTKGLSFYKLLGSGKENFDPRPDFSVYGVLQVWKDASYAAEYFDNSKLGKRYQKHSAHQLTFYLRNIKAHGLWSKQNPFEKSENLNPENPFVAVITRATIKLPMLRKFWNYVPSSQKDLIDNPNLLFTAGVGERPVTQMATFSVWNNVEALQQFAYRGKSHRDAIRQTQALQWYKEELFTRFQPYQIKGTWPDFEIPEFLK
ncbi:spheroidene monooxygenase [Nonlabens sp. Hel1_33_55]|nr:spheroidene monooxygenase [Nonlabens sp. Hel1_33_55]